MALQEGTILILDEDAGTREILCADFDPTRHKRAEEPKAAAPTTTQAPVPERSMEEELADLQGEPGNGKAKSR